MRRKGGGVQRSWEQTDTVYPGHLAAGSWGDLHPPPRLAFSLLGPSPQSISPLCLAFSRYD